MSKFYLKHTLASQNEPHFKDLSFIQDRGVNNREDIEKIVAADYYINLTSKYETYANNPNQPSAVREQYQNEIKQFTKQFLENSTREFLKLHDFKVVEK
jgi:hypothetical protein